MGVERELLVPDIGDFESVDVIEVLVAPGQRVEAEQSLITLESDKATMEIPAPWPGVVKRIDLAVGDAVSQRSKILLLEVDAAAAGAEPPPAGAAPTAGASPGTEPAPPRTGAPTPARPADRGDFPEDPAARLRAQSPHPPLLADPFSSRSHRPAFSEGK